MFVTHFIMTIIVITSPSFLTQPVPKRPCNRLQINNIWYEKETLWSELGRPHNLNIHKESNMLFFSYTLPENYSDLDFQLACYNIDTKEFQTIAGIRGGCSVAIDQANDEIYLGGSDGIYKYNMITKIADFYKEEGVNVWGLFYKINLFYISYPDQKLHIEVDGKFALVREFENTEIDHIYINDENVIYFANKTGLYKYNNVRNSTEVINDLVTVRQIAEDNDGNMYVCTNIGLFEDKRDYFEKVLDIKSIQGIAFDRDNNFVIADDKSIMKLIKSNTGCLSVTDNQW